MNPISFGECPICRQGRLLAMKRLSDGELLLMCDDCESQWASPQEAQSYENALLEEAAVTPSSIEDVRSSGWESYIVNDG